MTSETTLRFALRTELQKFLICPVRRRGETFSKIQNPLQNLFFLLFAGPPYRLEEALICTIIKKFFSGLQQHLSDKVNALNHRIRSFFITGDKMDESFQTHHQFRRKPYPYHMLVYSVQR